MNHIFYIKIFFPFMMAVLMACSSDKEPEIIETPPVEIEFGKLYYIDMENKSLNDLFMITSLQGNVNRISPLVWVLKTPVVEFDNGMIDRAFWFDRISDREKIRFTDPFLMIRDFSDKISGCVIYDEDLFGNYVSGAKHPQPSDNVVAKLNTTAMLCAVHNAVALTGDQRQKLLKQYGVELPVLADVTTDEFSNWVSCYRYMYRNHDNDLNKEVMANNSHYCLSMLDYFIAEKMFIFNIRGNPTPLDQELTDQVVSRCPSPSPVFGVWNLTGIEPTEDTYQKYYNAQGKYSIVNPGVFNLSFTSGLPAYSPEKSETNRGLKYDPAKKYICFTETDGDNYEFIQQVYPKRFEVPDREKYPIGWEIPGTLCRLDPVAAKWFYENIGQNCYVNPVTGAGYYKYRLPEEYMSEYLSLTESYMKESRLRTIRTMSYDFDSGELWTAVSCVDGVFCGYGGNDPTRPAVENYERTHMLHNGKPIFINYSYLDIDKIIEYKGTTPVFFSVACVYTNPADVIKTINQLSSDWMVVSPAEMVDLYKEYRATIN